MKYIPLYYIPCCNEIGFYYYPLSTTSSLSSAPAAVDVAWSWRWCLFVCCYLFLLLGVFHHSKTLCVFCSSLVKPKLKLKRSTDNNKGTKMARSNLGKVFFSAIVGVVVFVFGKDNRQKRKVFSIS